MPEEQIILAYSGGLDTSVAIRWLQEKYQAQVITLTIDLGMVDLEEIRQRALAIGAAGALTFDGKEAFYRDFVSPALRAGAIYEDQYPLATALGASTYCSEPRGSGPEARGASGGPRLHRQRQRPGAYRCKCCCSCSGAEGSSPHTGVGHEP